MLKAALKLTAACALNWSLTDRRSPAYR